MKTVKQETLKERGFYQSRAWRKVRLLALQRDRYLCQLRLSERCGRVATEVHHKIPLEKAPELGLELGNLVSCCWECHELTKHKGTEKKAPDGIRVISIRGDGDTDEK